MFDQTSPYDAYLIYIYQIIKHLHFNLLGFNFIESFFFIIDSANIIVSRYLEEILPYNPYYLKNM